MHTPKAPAPIHVAIEVLGMYPLFAPDIQDYFGGAELRAALFARGLAQQPDFQVSAITYDYGHPPHIIDHVQFYSHPAFPKIGDSRAVRQRIKRARQQGRPYPALLPDLAHLLWRRLRYVLRRQVKRPIAPYKQLNADIYLFFALTDQAAEIVQHARQNGAISVFFASREGNFDTLYASPQPQQQDVFGYYATNSAYVLQNVDYIFTQTQAQATLSKTRFNRNAHVIRNPIPLERVPIPPAEQRKAVLWVGRNTPIKQPQHFVELARRFPGQPFVMVMTHNAAATFDPDKAMPANLTLHEYVPRHAIDHIYANAAIFVITSEREGMPNVMLEAAKYSLPIVSLQVNPDQMLTQEAMGLCADGDFERMVALLGELIANPDKAQAMGQRGRAYLEREHDLDQQITRLATALRSIATQGKIPTKGRETANNDRNDRN